LEFAAMLEYRLSNATARFVWETFFNGCALLAWDGVCASNYLLAWQKLFRNAQIAYFMILFEVLKVIANSVTVVGILYIFLSDLPGN